MYYFGQAAEGGDDGSFPCWQAATLEFKLWELLKARCLKKTTWKGISKLIRYVPIRHLMSPVIRETDSRPLSLQSAKK
jgi:hypothetical protein